MLELLNPEKTAVSHLRPYGTCREIELVITAARCVLGTCDQETLEACLGQELRWDAVLRIAEWHKLDAILFRALRSCSNAAVPVEYLDQLEEQFRLHSFRALNLSSALASIMTTFQEAGIAFLQVKGLTLAQMIHEELACRPALDLDLVVHPDQLDLALRVLEEHHGYGFSDPNNARQREFQRKLDYEVSLCGAGVTLDLHWSLSRYQAMFPFNLEKALRHPYLVPIGHIEVPTLAPTDLIPYLAFHGSRHLWMKLFWILDLAAWIQRHPHLDWQGVVARAEDLRQQRSLAHGILLAERIFGTAVPAPVAALAAQDHALNGLVEKALAFLFTREHHMVPYEIEVNQREKLRWGAYMQTRWLGKLAVTTRYITHPGRADVLAFPLPRPLFPLYRLVRPLRLLKRSLLPKT